ncbi:MAG: hypothetical protein OEX02_03395 [Cyclobacteriaceae bacterium]|nr:hypothetical protein [Cyclobacteriaceae bacterium]
MKGITKSSYQNLSMERVEGILMELKSFGARISGDNPWIIDMSSRGLVFKGLWDDERSVFRIELIDESEFIPSAPTWALMNKIVKSFDGRSLSVR